MSLSVSLVAPSRPAAMLSQRRRRLSCCVRADLTRNGSIKTWEWARRDRNALMSDDTNGATDFMRRMMAHV